VTGARVLVTGAQGLLGRHLVARWRAQRPDATLLGVGRSPRLDDRFTHDLAWVGQRVPAPLPAYLAGPSAPAAGYTPLDLGDAAAVEDALHRFRPDVVVHAAAALRDSDWGSLLEANVRTVMVLVDALRKIPEPPRLVLVSSGSVYGPADPLPLPEVDATTPLEMYGASKRAAEDVARIGCRDAGIDLVRARVFNLIGPGLQDRHLPAALAGQLAAISGGQAPPRLEVGPLETTRDFVDVRDAAAVLLTLAETGRPGRVYNVASGVESPVSWVLDEMLRCTGLDDRVEVVRRAGRAADMPRAVADVTGIRALGVPPCRPLGQSVADLLHYYEGEVAAAYSRT